MSEAFGDQVFVEPLYLTTPIWHGRVVDVGAKAINESNFNECDPVKYSISNIVNITTYGNTIVHIVYYQNLAKDYPKEEGS